MRNLSKLLIISVIFVVVCFDVFAKRSTSFEKRPNCEKTGGVWRQFGNACADGCRVKFDDFMMCAQALTYSCDCLEDGCFDGEKCVKIADYQVLFQDIKKREKELLNEQKFDREVDFEQNRVRILQKIRGIDPNQPQNPDGLNPDGTPIDPLAPQPTTNNAPSRQAIRPIDVIVKQPSQLKNDVEFKVPPFFQRNQDQLKNSLDEKNVDGNVENQNNEDNKLPPTLPTIALP